MKDLSTPDYEFYIQDQRKDNIVGPPSKAWAYKYCDFLKALLPNENFASIKTLDVGCREFYTYDWFKEQGNPIKGIDVCEDSFEYAYQYDKEVLDVDAHKMLDHFKDEKFDLIMSFHCFEHLYDLPLVLQNCHKAINDAGYLYFAVPIPSRNERRGHWYDIPSVGAMLAMCEAAGFKTVLHSQLYPAGKFRNEDELVALLQK